MFVDSARSVISAASTASTSTSPPSSISLTSSAVSTGLQLGGDLPGLRGVRLVGDDREPSCPSEPLSARISSSANGKVCIVTAMISSPFFNAVASSPDFDFAPALRTSSGLIVATIFAGAVDLPDRVLQLRVEHGAVGDHDDRVEDLLVVHVQPASRCAVQAIVLVLPDPAECWIRYRCPRPPR